MADDRVIYTVVIDYTQNQASDVHYAELKAEIKAKLSVAAPRSKGTSESQFVSIAEA